MSIRSKNHLRLNSGNSDTIDLHGTTVAEAIVIVKEILDSETSSISQGKVQSYSYLWPTLRLRVVLHLLSATSAAAINRLHLSVCLGVCCHPAGTSCLFLALALPQTQRKTIENYYWAWYSFLE